MAESIDLTSLNKPELLKIAQELQGKVKDNCVYESKLAVLMKKVNSLQEQNQDLFDRIYHAEKHINGLSQYTRRENIEISGIPDDISQNELESRVIGILATIDVDVESYNIAACHRLKKLRHQTSANVIVRFTNRKHAVEALKNKKKLMNNPIAAAYGTQLYISENLCPLHRQMYDYALSLKKKKVIHSLWTHNGNICLKKVKMVKY